MKIKEEKSELVIKNIITGVLAAAFVVLLVVILVNIGRPRRMSDPMSDLRFSLKQGKYNQIYLSVENCRNRDYKGNSEYRKYEAIADYYFNYMEYLPLKITNPQKADECKEKMATLRKKMGDIAFAADDIDMMFAGYLNE